MNGGRGVIFRLGHIVKNSVKAGIEKGGLAGQSTCKGEEEGLVGLCQDV